MREMVEGLLETGTPFKKVDFMKLLDKYEQFDADLADDGDNEELEETDPQDIPAPTTTTNRLWTHKTPVLIPGATSSSLKGNVLPSNIMPKTMGPAARAADDNAVQDDGKGGLMTLSPAPRVGEVDIPVRDMRYIDQRDERFETHIPTFEDEE